MATFIYAAEGWESCRIVGDGKRVQHFRYIHSTTPDAEHEPSTEEWEKFWLMVETVGAWSWEGNYDEGVRCGTPWRLEIRLGSRVMNCRGNLTSLGTLPPGFERLYFAMLVVCQS